jgi:peroxin-19
MEALMSELGGPSDGSIIPGAPENETEEERREREKTFKAAWEAMLVAGMDGMQDSNLGIPVPDKASGSRPAASTSSSAVPEAGGAKDFESILRSTREKLSQGERELNPGNSSEGGDMDSLEQMLKQLQDLGGEDGEDFENMLENMMGTLMSKDILYEPLKELVDKVSFDLKILCL